MEEKRRGRRPTLKPKPAANKNAACEGGIFIGGKFPMLPRKAPKRREPGDAPDYPFSASFTRSDVENESTAFGAGAADHDQLVAVLFARGQDIVFVVAFAFENDRFAGAANALPA